MTSSHSHDPVSPVIRDVVPVPEPTELKSNDSRGVEPTLINLIVVSPHLEVRRQLADAIGPQPDLAVVAYATPAEALQWSDLASRCQAALVQVRRPGSRLYTIRALRCMHQALPIVAVLDRATPSIRRGVQQAGATVSADLNDLAQLVIIARKAGSGLTNPVKRGRKSCDHPTVSDMPEEDWEILWLLAQGWNKPAIACELDRSKSTVYKSIQRSRTRRNKDKRGKAT